MEILRKLKQVKITKSKIEIRRKIKTRFETVTEQNAGM